MQDSSTAATDAAYRRGTVLGLTVAEVFILLLFLVLIALLALVRDWQAERDALQAWRGVMEEFEAPQEIATLRQRKEAAERASEHHRKRVDMLESVLDTAGSAEVAAVLEAALAEAERASDEARQAKRELHVLRAKGQNPPCWYQTVPTPEGGAREKPYYTFNVAVFDDGMVVRRVPTPSGGASDDGDSMFADEAERLNLDALPYDRPLGDQTFLDSFQPVVEAARNGNVRTYPCIFWVRVWDQTSPTAKERWQRAHDATIESLFGTYHVKDDPWPSGA